VDLNATAVEFAEVSLWLDTMAPGLQAPWFGLHLRRGNSLVGCRRAVFSPQQVETKAWLGDVPQDVPLGEDIAGRIHHFLLPAPAWGAAVDAKEAKVLAPEARQKLNDWAKAIKASPTKQQVTQLQHLARRVEVLWGFSLRRLQIAEQEARRPIALWEQDSELDALDLSPVPRQEIERKLNDPEGAYQRLRRVMNAWNAMWFWPLTDTLLQGATPPTLQQWIDGLTAIVGRHSNYLLIGTTSAPRRKSSSGTRVRTALTRSCWITRGWERLSASPCSRASSTGNSTSAPCSPQVVASICRWEILHGFGRGQMWMPSWPR
jgi:hypothetical protein